MKDSLMELYMCIMPKLDEVDEANDQNLVHLKDGTREDVMTNHAIIGALDKRLASEANVAYEDPLWTFHAVLDHLKHSCRNYLGRSLTDLGSNQYQIGGLIQSPLQNKQKNLDCDEWKCLHVYVENEKKYSHAATSLPEQYGR
jgi:hypothetical protein